VDATLQYEAYQPMAEREIRAIIARAREQWKVRHVAISHRIGVVPQAESSVEIAISSAHRREALQAVQFAIDELKKSVPIWKKEVYVGEHGAKWKENVESAAPTIGELQYPDGGKAPTRSEYLQMAANGSPISRRGRETLVLVASLAVVLGAVAYARKR